MPLAYLTLATRDVRRAEAFFAGTLGWRPIDRPNHVGRADAVRPLLLPRPGGHGFEVVPAERAPEV